MIDIYKTQHVLQEVQNEREKQAKKWGGEEHDDKHNIRDWMKYVGSRVNSIIFRKGSMINNFKSDRKQLIQIAALAVAAVESMDRKEKNNG